MKNIVEFIKKALGWSVLIMLFIGGIAAVVYVVAIIIGGEIGAGIVSFMYNVFFVWLTYIVCASTLIGLIRVYIAKEHDFVLKKTSGAARKETPPTDEENADAQGEENTPHENKEDRNERRK